MATIDWSQLQAAAAAEGYTNEILPDAPYEVQVAGVKVGASQNGKPQIGVRLKVLTGVHANKSTWDNLTLTLDSPKAMAVFFRKAKDYGATQANFDAGEDLEAIASHFVGTVGVAVIGHRINGDKTYNQVTSFKPSASTVPPVQGFQPQSIAPSQVAPLSSVLPQTPGFPPPPVASGTPSF